MSRVLIVYGTTEGQTAKIAQHIAAKEGGETDTSRDFEYTDWDEVTRFAESFAGALPD